MYLFDSSLVDEINSFKLMKTPAYLQTRPVMIYNYFHLQNAPGFYTKHFSAPKNIVALKVLHIFISIIIPLFICETKIFVSLK